MLIILLLTTLPTLLYAWLLWWLDRYEKEPLPLLVAVFMWGAVPAVALALIAETDLKIATLGAGMGGHPLWLAPLIEEPLKATALVAIFLFFRYEFDGVLDGIIYGALIGFGFAMTENAIYLHHHATTLSSTLWLRAVLFGFSHAFFTSIVGVALGLIRYDRRPWIGWATLPGALLLAMFFHALHNSAVSYSFPGVLIAWLISSGGALVVVLVAVIAWTRERFWIERELIEEIQLGLLDETTYFVVRSGRRRIRAQLQGLARGGLRELRRVRELHHLLTELAFLKYQLRIGDCHCRPHDLLPLRNRIRQIHPAVRQSASPSPATLL